MSSGTFHRPSESISLTDFRFCCVVLAQLPNPLRVLSKTQPAAEVIGDWLLVIGYWIWAAKPHIRAFILYTLHFTLIPRAFTLYTLRFTL